VTGQDNRKIMIHKR